MARAYEQFVAFGVDNAGLERLLRFLQSTFMILTAYPILIAYILPSSPASVHISTKTCLSQFQGHVNITRRWMRLFRFFEAFNASWTLYQSQGKSFDTWLDVLSKSCMGMFGLLESVTLLDLAPVDYLVVFGAEQTVKLNLDAQRFWFVALYASVISTGFKLLRILAYKPVPPTGEGFGTGEEVESKDGSSVEKDKEKMKEIAEKRKEERKVRAEEAREKTTVLGLKLLADVLDLTIPASAVGWIQLSSGTVGVAMWLSTILTGLDVWKRVGKELDKRNA